MALKFKLLHKLEAGSAEPALPPNYWQMATCLRTLVLTEEAIVAEGFGDFEILEDEKAFEFLLQVICGLHSPLIGETEIFGQFKKFVKDNAEGFTPSMAELTNRLLVEAKKMRHQFLQNLGCTSYGSLLRKQMRDRKMPLVILGAGALTRDILPWFAKSSLPVTVYTRQPEKYQDLVTEFPFVSLHKLADFSGGTSEGVLVIAAPLRAEWLQQELSHHGFQQIYDLRGESSHDSLELPKVKTLAQIFASIQGNREQAETVKERVLAAIEKSAEQFGLLEKPRPFGWEDLWTYS